MGDFYEQDAKGKKHLCLVLDVLGSSIEDVRLGNIYDGEYLPLHSVKKIAGFGTAEDFYAMPKDMLIRKADILDRNSIFIYGLVGSNIEYPRKLQACKG